MLESFVAGAAASASDPSFAQGEVIWFTAAFKGEADQCRRAKHVKMRMQGRIAAGGIDRSFCVASP